ncbi:MAG: helix-turn-helix transcriptional regulator [Hydrogenophaga sp.]|nr:helix-turn-helix transcriptional regulator [Hydrogenophaga sp.]
MTTFAATLKKEIARIARKELREDIAALRKAATSHRHEIAVLKRELRETQTALRDAERRTGKSLQQLGKARPAPAAAEPVARARGRRAVFSAERFKAQRERLGLTQKAMAAHLGTSALSVWKWESGQVTPRARFLPAILALRTQGKRDVARALQTTA